MICTKALPTSASLVAQDPAEIFRYNVTPEQDIVVAIYDQRLGGKMGVEQKFAALASCRAGPSPA